MSEEKYTQLHNHRCCNSCEDGSFEQAYHRLQQASAHVNDLVFMFEAGKRSAILLDRVQIHKKCRVAITKTLKEIFKEQP